MPLSLVPETPADTQSPAIPQNPVCIPLQDIREEAVGGKAEGLAKLLALGLAVPPGFVVLNASEEQLPKDLQQHYEQLGEGKVAVRSSAIGEDGEEASFAGQFDTILNVEGSDELVRAVKQCIASTEAAHVNAYQNTQATELPAMQMCVVVQRMVDAQYAGVLFTADPVSARRDIVVIDAVTGLGESLVSGEATPDHYELDASGAIYYQELIDDKPLLDTIALKSLFFGAKDAERRLGQPLDMEWAIDASGELFWLQARPVTTLPADLQELDAGLNKPDDVITRCNIGEMLPGAVSPLTFSVTARGIEWGMQHMHTAYAGRTEINDDWTQTTMYYGHLFLNMSGSAESCKTVLGVDVESMGYSLCGRLVPELEAPRPKNILRRIWGAARLARYVFTADKAIAAHDLKVAQYKVEAKNNASDMIRELEQKLDMVNVSMAVHLQSSSTSGFTGTTLQRMITGGSHSTPEHEAELARLLAGATGVESAVLVDQLDEINATIAAQPDSAEHFDNVSAEEALAWLRSPKAKEANLKFQAFITRHGHRSYRELDIRQLCWADDTLPLISIMQGAVPVFRKDNQAQKTPEVISTEGLSRGIRWILPKAHNAVRRREYTKSMLVDVTNRMKRGYRHLGQLMVEEGSLADADLVYFFTHKELVACQAKPSIAQQAQAEKRRKALPYQESLEFPEVSVGVPKPIDSRALLASTDGVLSGRSVSRGRVEGVVRVARNLEEAKGIQEGEILVAPITDVGWTPYFNLIAGLVTDVGSAVSHGAVIAREYGLPCLVNTRTATKTFKTGDRVCLDAEKGTITLLPNA